MTSDLEREKVPTWLIVMLLFLGCTVGGVVIGGWITYRPGRDGLGFFSTMYGAMWGFGIGCPVGLIAGALTAVIRGRDRSFERRRRRPRRIQ